MSIPQEILNELVNIGCTPWGDFYQGSKPTQQSIIKIELELEIKLPNSFIEIAQNTPMYGGWFCSIGPDYESPMHIIYVNAVFHASDDEIPLPSNLIIFNHGHDGDCDCFDTDCKSEDNQLEVVYIPLEAGEVKIKKRWPSFDQYLVDFVRDHAGTHYKKSLKKRAKALLAQAGITN